jgi:ribonuclease HI
MPRGARRVTIDAAADGSSLGNPGPSGWGWYVDADHWAAGGWRRGTNNMGELMAVLDLLRQSEPLGEDLRVHCDSRYVIDAVTKWTPGWKAKGWRKADGKPVLNLDLIQAIDEQMGRRRAAGRRVDFVWVKGHAGHPLNEQADRLANGAATAYQGGGVPDPGPGFGSRGPQGRPVEHPAQGELW